MTPDFLTLDDNACREIIISPGNNDHDNKVSYSLLNWFMIIHLFKDIHCGTKFDDGLEYKKIMNT